MAYWGVSLVPQPHKETIYPMKKILSLMLGLSLILGTTSLAFGQDNPAPEKKTKTKKKGKKKKGGDTSTPPSSN